MSALTYAEASIACRVASTHGALMVLLVAVACDGKVCMSVLGLISTLALIWLRQLVLGSCVGICREVGKGGVVLVFTEEAVVVVISEVEF